MADSPPSSSDDALAAFRCLHPDIQRWIHGQGWTTLRGIQVRAVEPIQAGRDVLISATTAGGKTEAAFLPICSELVGDAAGSIRCLQISPLKALINDQFGRLEDLCEEVGIPVHRWHGDVPQARKLRVVREPGGILLITPESLEALHVNHGPHLAGIFGGLRWIVVDELHAFIGSERGKQLQSLMHRLDLLLRRPVPRIGLSATLGDMGLAAEFLRPGHAVDVVEVVSQGGSHGLQLELRGFRAAAPSEGRPSADDGDLAVADELYRELRGAHHLVFANSRTNVEWFGDQLARRAEADGGPQRFLAHHGSLAKGEREDVEALLRSAEQPVTVVCTSTLELGIDIGGVKSVAQVGCPPSVSSLRQRLGRSGRGEHDPHVLRCCVVQDEVSPLTAPPEALRVELVQTLAMITLMLAPHRWCEPPDPARLHLSTWVQQVLSLIAQHGGIMVQDAYKALCRSGPFEALTSEQFVQALRCLASHALVEQDATGLVLLGREGERLVNHYSFYTAFETPTEWRVVTQGRELGSIAPPHGWQVGGYLIFAARRWVISALDPDRKVVEVEPAKAGRLPRFAGSGGAPVHDRVRRQMRALYLGTEVPAYLDPTARSLLTEARQWFRDYGLEHTWLLEQGADTYIFPWSGDVILNTLLLALQQHGVEADWGQSCLVVRDCPAAQLIERVQALHDGGPVGAVDLASGLGNLACEKHHHYLDPDLLAADYARARLDTAATWARLGEFVALAGSPGR